MRSALVVVALGLVACRGRFQARTGDADASDGSISPTTIRVIVTGHGVALVENQPPCSDECTYDVGTLEITAWAGQAWQLASFGGDCSGASCTAQPGSTVTVTFERAPITANLAFISTTAAPRTGLAGLDATCAADAAAAGLPGTFIAFASTSAIDARDRFSGARGWVGMDGLPIIDTPADFSSPARVRSITLDQTGAPRANAAQTGTFANGTKDTAGACSDWTGTAGQATCGYSDWARTYTISNVNTSCGNPVAVYCMQTDRNVAVSLAHPPAPMGRYVFVTDTAWTISGGIAGADAFCMSQAASGGLAGTYRAILATTTQSAADHIGGIAGMWRRPDGVVVAFEGLDEDPLEAAIMADASGALALGNDTMFGAMGGLTALGTATCNDWMDGGAPSRFDTFFLSTRPWTKAGSPPSCASPSRIFCAQML